MVKAAIIGRAGADPLFMVHLADKQRIEANTRWWWWWWWWVGDRSGVIGGRGSALLPRHGIVVYSKCHACLISQNYGSSCSSFNGSSRCAIAIAHPVLLSPPLFLFSPPPLSVSFLGGKKEEIVRRNDRASVVVLKTDRMTEKCHKKCRCVARMFYG